ncbi:hypothetical protein PV326_011499, partial [Microctonus aethiopoides]
NSVFNGSGGISNDGSETFPDAQQRPADSPFLFRCHIQTQDGEVIHVSMRDVLVRVIDQVLCVRRWLVDVPLVCLNLAVRRRSLHCSRLSFARIFATWTLKFTLSVKCSSAVLFNRQKRTISALRVRRPMFPPAHPRRLIFDSLIESSAVYAGIGCTVLNKLLSCLNIPIMSPGLYKRYEREIGPAFEEDAKDFCRRTAKEERELIIKKVD